MALSTFTLSCNHPHHHLQNFLIFPNWNSVPMKHSLPVPSPSPCNFSSLFSRDVPVLFTSCKWNGAVFALRVWLIALSIFQGLPCRSLGQNSIPLCGWIRFRCITRHILSIHLSMDTWLLSIFWQLWIMLLRTFVYKYPSKSLFSTLLSLWRNNQTISHSGCAILKSHQQCLRVPTSSHSHQQLL